MDVRLSSGERGREGSCGMLRKVTRVARVVLVCASRMAGRLEMKSESKRESLFKSTWMEVQAREGEGGGRGLRQRTEAHGGWEKRHSWVKAEGKRRRSRRKK
jgi:hypothetical protein